MPQEKKNLTVCKICVASSQSGYSSNLEDPHAQSPLDVALCTTSPNAPRAFPFSPSMGLYEYPYIGDGRGDRDTTRE